MIGRFSEMSKVHCLYLGNHLYAWTEDKHLFHLFLRQRDPSKFQYKKVKVGDNRALDSRYHLTTMILSIGDMDIKMVVTIEEQSKFDRAYATLKDFFRYMNSIYGRNLILNQEDRETILEITDVLVDDDMIVDNKFLIDELQLFSKLYSNTLNGEI